MIYGDALCFVLSASRTSHAVKLVLNKFIPGYKEIDGDYAFNLNTDQTFDSEENVLRYLENAKSEAGTIHWKKETDNPDKIMVGAYFTSDGHLILSITLHADGSKEEKYFNELRGILTSDVGMISYNQFPEFKDGEDFKNRCGL